MSRKILKYGIAIGFILLFTACGEGGIDDNDKNSTNIYGFDTNDINLTNDENISDVNISSIIDTDIFLNEGHYIDSSVEGVTYNCGDQSGVTDENGTFRFEDGVTCTFTIGNVVLEEVDTDTLDDNMIVLEDDIDDARFLQTLDNDGNASNGIEITSDVRDIISEISIDTTPVSDEDIEAIFQTIEEEVEDYNGMIVSIEEAQHHLETTIQELEENLDDIQNTTDSELDNLFNNL